MYRFAFYGKYSQTLFLASVELKPGVWTIWIFVAHYVAKDLVLYEAAMPLPLLSDQLLQFHKSTLPLSRLPATINQVSNDKFKSENVLMMNCAILCLT